MMPVFLFLSLVLPLGATAQSAPPIPHSPQAGHGGQVIAEKFRRMQHEMQASGSETPGSAAVESRSFPWLALEVGAALLFVLGAAVVSIRLLGRAQRGMLRGASADGDLLEVIETCHLGQGQKLVAVRLDGKIAVVGISKESVSFLSVLDRPASEILAERRRGGNPALFADNLNRMLEKFKKPKKVSDLLPPEEG